MLRTAGALMMIAAAAALAFCGLAGLNKRLAALRGLKQAMAFISSCIGFSQKPLIQICDELQQRLPPEAGVVFENLGTGMKQGRQGAQLWQESLEKTCLTKDEINVYLPLGACLGMTDKSLQIKTAEMIINGSALCEEKLLSRIDRYKAVDLKITLMLGIMAVILLI